MARLIQLFIAAVIARKSLSFSAFLTHYASRVPFRHGHYIGAMYSAGSNRCLVAKRSTKTKATTTMAATAPSSAIRRLVLVGGGHAHVQVLKSLHKSIRPANMSVTLVDAQCDASYSGMVPGCVSRLYSPDETLIKLRPLTKWAGIDFVHGTVVDVDFDCKRLIINGDEASFDKAEKERGIELDFDIVCFDIGSASRGLDTPGALDFSIPTRPISDLVRRIQYAEDELTKTLESGQSNIAARIVVVGGGAAGIELSLAMRARWGHLFDNHHDLSVTLLDSGSELLPSENEKCRAALLSVLEDHFITVRHGSVVSQITSDEIHLEDGQVIPYTHCLWATGASSHPLANVAMRRRGLAVSDRGWIRVDKTLRSLSHPFVFAAGDCAQMEGIDGGQESPPKAGVYAVRAGPILIENLIRAMALLDDEGRKSDSEKYELVTYKPQGDFLKLLMCGDETALGFRFGLPLRGKWVWQMKDHIDTMFMSLFAEENLPYIKEGDGYDTSQYDAVTNRPAPLEPEEAGRLLMRTDEKVDYQRAWNVLRDMMEDESYKTKVLKLIETM